MRYDYTIYHPGSSEHVAATFSIDEPIAHILVGHWLTLTTPEFSTQTGHHLRIVGVECHLSQNQVHQMMKTRVEIYVTEEARTPQ